MKQIIFNADDFGLAASINAAVNEASRFGLLTSASLCVMGPAAEEAVAMAATLPNLSVGLHVTLVDEQPASAPTDIPTLVDATGRLPQSGIEFARRWVMGKIAAADVEREVSAQWSRAVQMGVPITHFDSHDHIHVLPGILEICLDAATAHRVSSLRVPLETTPVGAPRLRRGLFGIALSALSQRAARVARARGFAFPAGFSGFRGAGAIDTSSLIARIESAGKGPTEIALHPALSNPPRVDMQDWDYRWSDEYHALVDPKTAKALRAVNGTAVSYRALSE
jgi:hopanoid biosynthesis associated protein HpnK